MHRVENITLTLVGHTNTGKTALARTLLARDVGEVRDAPHVTTAVETHAWVTTGDWTLRLADTPGLDDARRLRDRLRHGDSLLGRWLREVWDRTTDSGFYHTQTALRQVAQDTDVVLYLVDTAAEPALPGATTLAEIALLGLLGRPTIVVLNQTGRSWAHAEAATAEGRWQEVLRPHAFVGGVATLDAFTRCWPCELMLLDRVGRVLPPPKSSGLAIVRAALWRRHEAVFTQAMHAVADAVIAMAADSEAREQTDFLRRAQRVVGQLVFGAEEKKERDRWHGRLRGRLMDHYAKLVDRMIAGHGLSGRTLRRELPTGVQDVSGGAPPRIMLRELAIAAAGGAGAGGAIDVAVGGASLGAGMAIGAIVGAVAAIGLGAHDLAERADGRVGWREAAVLAHLAVCLRTYLAVAHYGRGQGAWRDHDGPDDWRAVVETALHEHRAALGEGIAGDPERCRRACVAVGRSALRTLYPIGELSSDSGAVSSAGSAAIPAHP